MNTFSIILVILILIFISSSSCQRIIKSQWTNGYPTYSAQFKLQTNPVEINFYTWILPLVGNTLTNKMEIVRISNMESLNIANELTSKILLVSVNTIGLELQLNVLPLNGYYFFDDSGTSLPNTSTLPTQDIYKNQGLSNQISYSQSLGSQQIKMFESSQQQSGGISNDQMIFQYSIKLGIQITGSFLTQKQIFRMTIDPSLNDERNLGYCIVCIYIYQNKIIFSTYSLEKGTFSQQSLSVEIQNIDFSKIYYLVVQFDETSFTIFDDQKGKLNQIQVSQAPLMGFTTLSGGNFLSNSFYSGKLYQVMVNYGKQQAVQSSISEFKVCQNKYCAACTLEHLEICNTCIISENDPNKNPTLCECQSSYFLDIIGKCSQCHSTCTKCDGSSPTQCTECIDTRELTSGQVSGQCVCKPKYFDDTFNSKCQSCYKDCLTCNGYGSQNCSTCAKGRIVNSLGECVCQSNYFRSGDDCLQCDKLCMTCNSSKSCLTCGLNQVLDDKTQLCKCKTGYYPVVDGDFIKCQECTEFCDECKGPGEKECTLCNNKFTLFFDQSSTNQGSCVYKKYMQTKSFNSSFNIQSEQAIQYCVLIIILIDFFANVYSNRFTFSRVFRMQQFLLKIFYLKLIDSDFVQSNYQLLSGLSFYNGLSSTFYYLNPFGNLPTIPKAQDRVKIKLEQISPEFLNSSGGVLFIEILLFIFTLILALIVKSKGRPQSNAFDSNNPNDTSRIDQQMIANHQSNSGHQTIKNEDFISKCNFIMQNIFWHFNDYAINVFCFGILLHLAGPPSEQQEARAENFVCYFMLLYIFLVYLLLRSYLIRKPKQKQNYLEDKKQAIEKDKLYEQIRRNSGYQSPLIQIQHVNGDESEFENVLNSPEQAQNQEDGNLSQSQQNHHTPNNRSGSASSQSENEQEEEKPVILPNYSIWKQKLLLHDSICLNGLFECLHMEYIPMQKGCKFYFWVYVLNYFSISATVIGPINDSTSQYVSLAIVQFVFLICSLFRPYQDTFESLKNIIDNVIFFIVVVLQFVQSWLVSNNSKNFILDPNKETLINSYSWASFSLLLVAMIAFMGLSIAQIFTKKNYLIQLEEQVLKDEQKLRENGIRQENLNSEQHQSVSSSEHNQGNNYEEIQYIQGQQQQQQQQFTQQIEMEQFNNGNSSLVPYQITKKSNSIAMQDNNFNLGIYNNNIGIFDQYSSQKYIQSANNHRYKKSNLQNFNTLRTNDYFNSGILNTDSNQVQLQLVSQEFNTEQELNIFQQQRSSQPNFINQNLHGNIQLSQIESGTINIFQKADSYTNNNPEDSDSNKQPFSSDSDSLGRSNLNEDLNLLHKKESENNNQIRQQQQQQQQFNQFNSPSEQFNINEEELKENK